MIGRLQSCGRRRLGAVLIMKTPIRTGLFAVAALLAACAATPSEESRLALQQVRQAYDAGNYGAVIRDVATSSALAQGPTAVRVEALKLQSFSYCVTDYTQLCKDSFARILQLQPSFELTPTEKNHPQWGPVFQQAKVEQAG